MFSGVMTFKLRYLSILPLVLAVAAFAHTEGDPAAHHRARSSKPSQTHGTSVAKRKTAAHAAAGARAGHPSGRSSSKLRGAAARQPRQASRPGVGQGPQDGAGVSGLHGPAPHGTATGGQPHSGRLSRRGGLRATSCGHAMPERLAWLALGYAICSMSSTRRRSPRWRRPGRRRASSMTTFSTGGAAYAGQGDSAKVVELLRDFDRADAGVDLPQRRGGCLRQRVERPGQDAGGDCLPGGASPAGTRAEWSWRWAKSYLHSEHPEKGMEILKHLYFTMPASPEAVEAAVAADGRRLRAGGQLRRREDAGPTCWRRRDAGPRPSAPTANWRARLPAEEQGSVQVALASVLRHTERGGRTGAAGAGAGHRRGQRAAALPAGRDCAQRGQRERAGRQPGAHEAGGSGEPVVRAGAAFGGELLPAGEGLRARHRALPRDAAALPQQLRGPATRTGRRHGSPTGRDAGTRRGRRFENQVALVSGPSRGSRPLSTGARALPRMSTTTPWRAPGTRSSPSASAITTTDAWDASGWRAAWPRPSRNERWQLTRAALREPRRTRTRCWRRFRR